MEREQTRNDEAVRGSGYAGTGITGAGITGIGNTGNGSIGDDISVAGNAGTGITGIGSIGADTADGISLNELLQENTGLQSQFDRAISKALNTARSNWEREQHEAARQAAGMATAEQERAFNEREQALAARERRAGAVATLGERGLPVELADCLRYEDEDSLSHSLEAVERAFSLQVQRAVSQRMKGTPPKGGGEAAYTSQMRAALGLK